jgi:hypothetical protein
MEKNLFVGKRGLVLLLHELHYHSYFSLEIEGFAKGFLKKELVYDFPSSTTVLQRKLLIVQ